MSGTTGVELAIAARPRDGRVLQVPKDFTSVQAAVLAAKPGDCVALSSGTHELQHPLLIDRDIHLIAGDEGSAGVTLKLNTKNGHLLRPGTHMITVDCGSCRLGHLTLEHVGGSDDLGGELVFTVWCRRGSVLVDQCTINTDVHSAVGASAESQPTVSRCNVTAKDYGVWVEAAASGVRVDRCSFSRPRRGVFFSERAGGEVENCEFNGCGVGIECHHSCDALVGGNTLRNSKEAGVYCFGGVRMDNSPIVRVYGNDFEAGNCKGLVVDCAKPEATKNSFTGCVQCAIDISGGSKGRFVSNSIQGGSLGARIVGQSNPLLRRNTFESCSEAGVRISDARSLGNLVANTFDTCSIGVEISHRANPTIVSNVVTGGDVALVIADQGLGRIRSNEIVECKKGCTISSGSDPVLEQNEISRCGTAVIVDAARGSLLQNDVTGSEQAAVQLIASEGTVIEENTISGGGQEGILATRASRAAISGNAIHSNAAAEVQVSEDSRALITVDGTVLKEPPPAIQQ